MEPINGRYELKSEIRRDGYRTAWYAWDHNLNIQVVIEEFSDPDPEKRRRFMKEARALAQVPGSDGIINVRDCLQTGDKVYMVMDHLEEDHRTNAGKKGTAAPGKKDQKRSMIPAILAGIVIIGLAVFFLAKGGTGGSGISAGQSENVEYEEGSSLIAFKDMTITGKEIEFVKNHEDIMGAAFYSCQISDEIIGRMTEWSKVEKIDIYSCEGFSSLDPLADLPMLSHIDLNWGSGVPFAGDQLFTKDFPQKIEEFTLECGSIEGSAGFMRHFTGVTKLSFSVKESVDDLSFLEAMPKLKTIFIEHQTMNEAACRCLNGHPDLEEAEFGDTGLANLDWAGECRKIRIINAENSRVSDLTPLADHTDLQVLNLSKAPVSDLSPLENC